MEDQSSGLGDHCRYPPWKHVKQFSIKNMLYLVAIPAVFLGGWIANESWSVLRLPHRMYLNDPAYGKHASPVIYEPSTFKQELKRLVDDKNYPTAIALLDSAYVDDQINFDGAIQYYAIGGYSITLPGTNVQFDRERDWYMPGTGCSIDSFLWVERALRFAKLYNIRLDKLKNGG